MNHQWLKTNVLKKVDQESAKLLAQISLSIDFLNHIRSNKLQLPKLEAKSYVGVRKMIVRILLILVPVFLIACASVDVDTMNPSLQSPITTTAEKIGFNFELGSMDNIKFTEDASARPPTIDPKSRPKTDLRAHLNYGVNSILDFSMGLNHNLGVILNSRLSLINEPTNPFLLAGTLYYGYDPTNKSGDQNGEFGPGGFNWNAKANGSVASVGLSAGYRLSENVLIYLHGGVGRSSVDLKINQDAANGDPGGSYSYNNSAKLRHLGFGLMLGKETKYTLGVQHTTKDWSDSTLDNTATTHAILKIESK